MTIVSVIIPTFNRALKLVRAVSSVMDQTYKDREIIIVDDGSTDETEHLLSRFGSRIVFIKHPCNKGVSAARNTGIRHAKGRLIAFLDSDDYWFEQKLEVQTGFFDKNPEALICQTEEIWIRNGIRVNPMKKHVKPSGDVFEPSLKLCLVSPSAVMLKKSLIDEVGLFDENLPACEDFDLWLRVSCRFPVYLIDEYMLVKEGGHPDQLSARYKGMDKFRIESIGNLIKSGLLNKKQLDSAFQELSYKCRIYGNGCIKRGRTDEGNYYLSLPGKIAEFISG